MMENLSFSSDWQIKPVVVKNWKRLYPNENFNLSFFFNKKDATTTPNIAAPSRLRPT